MMRQTAYYLAAFAFAAHAAFAQEASANSAAVSTAASADTSAVSKTQPAVEKKSGSSDLDEAAAARQLESYEVTAMRFDDSIFDMPVNGQNISAETIAESGLTSIPEVLRRYGDVYLRNYSGSVNNAEISMRGFGSNSTQRVLVLVDGQRMNRLDMAAINWSQIPLEEIENIEVMRGPQTANYGNHAVGGVINISTKKWNQPNSVDFGGSYGEYDEYTAWGRANYSNDDYFASANANYYHNGGYVDYSGSWSKSAGMNAGVKFNDATDATMYASVGNEFMSWANPQTSYAAMMANPKYSSGVNMENKIDYLTLVGALNSHTSNGEGALEFGANAKKKNTYYPSYGSTSNSTLWTYSATPHYRAYIGGEDNRYLEGGVDFYFDDMTTDGSGFSSYNIDIQRLTAAPWVGGKYALNDTFSLNASGRYEYAMNNLSGNASGYNEYRNLNGLAAQFGANAKINESWNVYFRFDQLYRYPAIDEMFSCYGYLPSGLKLDPEHGQNYEIGTNFKMDGWSAGASLFYMHLDDEISYNPSTYSNENIGNTDRYGLDVNFGYDAKIAGFSTSWTFVAAHFADGQYEGKAVPLVPSIVSTTLAWVKPVDFCRLDFAYQWTSRQYMDSDFTNSLGKMPAFWTIDLTANFFVGENVRLFVGVQNITDETYASVASYNSWSGEAWYTSPGRTVRGGVEIKF